MVSHSYAEGEEDINYSNTEDGLLSSNIQVTVLDLTVIASAIDHRLVDVVTVATGDPLPAPYPELDSAS